MYIRAGLLDVSALEPRDVPDWACDEMLCHTWNTVYLFVLI